MDSNPHKRMMMDLVKTVLAAKNPSASKLVQIFWEEFGEPPPKEILDIFRKELDKRYAASSSTKKILLVDDEQQILDLIITRLATKPYHQDIMTSTNGKEAMKIIESNRVGLVITDLRLPGADGFTLIDFIKAEYPSVPAVVMSAFITPSIEERLKQKGTFQILRKPLNFIKLHETIVEALKSVAQAAAPPGISVKNFLILLKMERKTFMAEVFNSKGKRALVYVDKGSLSDVVCGSLKGEAAALHLLNWDLVQIRFKKMPGKKVKRNIYQGLMPLLMEAAKVEADKRLHEPASTGEGMARDASGRSIRP